MLRLKSRTCLNKKLNEIINPLLLERISRYSELRSLDEVGSACFSTKTCNKEIYKLSLIQKLFLTTTGAFGSVIMPERADLVGAIGETTGEYAYKDIIHEMKKSQSGREILSSRPRVTKTTLEVASSCSEGTFGYAYSNFMLSKTFSPDGRAPIRFLDDDEVAYVAVRMREAHDFWHVLFDCPTSVRGELTLKLMEFTQTRAPLCALSAILAPMRLSQEDRSYLNEIGYPLAYFAGKNAATLMCLDYESNFHRSLDMLRTEWNIIKLGATVRD
jgi:ubiquinone biosynthesis protein COQ4